MNLADFEAELNRSVWEGRQITKPWHRLALAVLSFALLALGLFALAAWYNQAHSLETYTVRVQKDMTPAEVDAIFGRPPDQQDRHDARMRGDMWRAAGAVDPRSRNFSEWRDADGACATVTFDHGRVVDAGWHPPPPMTMLEKCQRWFRFLNWK